MSSNDRRTRPAPGNDHGQEGDQLHAAHIDRALRRLRTHNSLKQRRNSGTLRSKGYV
jgi:hypothetical protein